MIYLNLSKTHDKVPYNLLLLKLNSYGICGPLLSWFRTIVLFADDSISYSTLLIQMSVGTRGAKLGVEHTELYYITGGSAPIIFQAHK